MSIPTERIISEMLFVFSSSGGKKLEFDGKIVSLNVGAGSL